MGFSLGLRVWLSVLGLGFGDLAQGFEFRVLGFGVGFWVLGYGLGLGV